MLPAPFRELVKVPGATASPLTTPGDILATPAVHSQSDFLLTPRGAPDNRKETSPSQPQLIIPGAASWDLEELDVLASETEGKMVDVPTPGLCSSDPRARSCSLGYNEYSSAPMIRLCTPLT